jgi:hypothetical protein
MASQRIAIETSEEWEELWHLTVLSMKLAVVPADPEHSCHRIPLACVETLYLNDGTVHN